MSADAVRNALASDSPCPGGELPALRSHATRAEAYRGLRSSVGVENVAVSHRGLVVPGTGARASGRAHFPGVLRSTAGLSLVLVSLCGVKGHWNLPGGGRETWLWQTFRGADVARVASGIGVIWVIMVGM